MELEASEINGQEHLGHQVQLMIPSWSGQHVKVHGQKETVMMNGNKMTAI